MEEQLKNAEEIFGQEPEAVFGNLHRAQVERIANGQADMVDLDVLLGQEVRKVRETEGLSHSGLAAQVGATPFDLIALERGLIPFMEVKPEMMMGLLIKYPQIAQAPVMGVINAHVARASSEMEGKNG